MTGAQLSGIPSRELTPALLNPIQELTDENFRVNVIMELMPHGKINSVPSEATPYRHHLSGNALILIQWFKDSLEYGPKAKEVVRELTTVLKSSGESYGNYGMPLDFIKDALAADISQAGDVVVEAASKQGVDRSQKFFGDYYPKLQALKKKYDPDQIFNRWFVITPA